MTDKQYEAIFSAIAEKLITQERTIEIQNYRIKDLEAKLQEAEYHLNPAGKEKPAKLEIR